MPSLAINATYEALLRDRSQDAAVRDYLRGKVRAARELIGAIPLREAARESASHGQSEAAQRAAIWAKSVENVPKSVSRVCCSSAASARCQEAPLACRRHSLAPRECREPTRPIRLDAALAVELQQTRRRACHRRRPVGGDGV